MCAPDTDQNTVQEVQVHLDLLGHGDLLPVVLPHPLLLPGLILIRRQRQELGVLVLPSGIKQHHKARIKISQSRTTRKMKRFTVLLILKAFITLILLP